MESQVSYEIRAKPSERLAVEVGRGKRFAWESFDPPPVNENPSVWTARGARTCQEAGGQAGAANPGSWNERAQQPEHGLLPWLLGKSETYPRWDPFREPATFHFPVRGSASFKTRRTRPRLFTHSGVFDSNHPRPPLLSKHLSWLEGQRWPEGLASGPRPSPGSRRGSSTGSRGRCSSARGCGRRR